VQLAFETLLEAVHVEAIKVTKEGGDANGADGAEGAGGKESFKLGGGGSKGGGDKPESSCC
jgi:hypothetical protein